MWSIPRTAESPRRTHRLCESEALRGTGLTTAFANTRTTVVLLAVVGFYMSGAPAVGSCTTWEESWHWWRF